jgi:hypothetical protein
VTRARIYFISETAPVNTHASSVVFYRHLQQLTAEGHHVIWVTDHNSYLANSDKVKQWECIVLPNRRWHLPPYRGRGLAQYYRFKYYYRRYLQKVISDGPAILLTHISGQFLAPFSAYVHKRTQIPLISFFHDDILELNFNRNRKSLVKNTKKVLEASMSVLTVSAEFKNNWPLYSSKFRLLYPLPEVYHPSRYVITEKQKANFTIAYAGAVYEEILPCFERLLYYLKDTNHRLLIIGDLEKTRSLSNRFPENLVCRDLFEKPQEAFDFLTRNSEAMIIPYPTEINMMPWIATCFPSKFLQYCQLNLPTIIIAPVMSAIGKWCIDHSWPLYSADYSPESLSRLLSERNKEAAIARITNLNAGDFNPRNIAWQFEETVQYAINSVIKCQ